MVDLLEVDLSKIDYVVGIESRGFIFGTAMAWITNSGFKMIRKPGKLPNQANLVSFKYDLEYGSDTIEMERGQGNVIIVDDVFATGGTMEAAKEICVEAGYEVLDTICLLDIGLIKDHDTKILLKTCDVVDMEIYSIAVSCLLENKSLYCYKWVSDDGDSSRWLENAALGFENFKKLFKERFL